MPGKLDYFGHISNNLFFRRRCFSEIKCRFIRFRRFCRFNKFSEFLVLVAASAQKYVLDVVLTANVATILPVLAVLPAASAQKCVLGAALAANAAKLF